MTMVLTLLLMHLDQVRLSSSRTHFGRLTYLFLVIQGTADADVSGKLTHDEVVKTVDFCLHAFEATTPEERQKVLEKVAAINGASSTVPDDKASIEKLSEDELKILNHIRAKQMLRFEDTLNLNHFGSDAIDGLTPNLKRGSLSLIPQGKNPLSKLEVPILDLLDQVKEHEHKPMSAEAEMNPISAAA